MAKRYARPTILWSTSVRLALGPISQILLAPSMVDHRCVTRLNLMRSPFISYVMGSPDLVRNGSASCSRMRCSTAEKSSCVMPTSLAYKPLVFASRKR